MRGEVAALPLAGIASAHDTVTELGALRAQLNKLENSSSKANGDGDYTARYREFKYQETLFELFAKQYELAKVDEAREGAVIQVLDLAQTPEKKSKPRKALIAMLATLGSGFALLLYDAAGLLQPFFCNTVGHVRRTIQTFNKLLPVFKSCSVYIQVR